MPSPPTSLQQLGQAIIAARLKQQMTQRELAARSKVHVNYVCGIERGDRNPTVLVLARLAAALELPVWKLLKDADL